MKHTTQLLLALAAAFSIPAAAQVNYQNHSVTPPLVTVNNYVFPQVQTYAIVGTSDTIPATPTFRYGGSSDGAGILKNSSGSYTAVVNHEDNYAVSRITLDSTFAPVGGEYILNSNAGMWRLCSATLATPQTHGFGPTFITCGESSAESMTHMVDVYGNPILDSTTSANTTLATGIGHWNAENAVPLPLATYNQTVVIIGDDDSGPNGGQVALYIGNSVGDLNDGHLYVLRRTDLNQRERDIIPGQTYPVEFVEIPNATALTGAQIDAYSSATLKAIEFQRVEDLDYRKGSPSAAREIYFNATGAATADSIDRTVWGRVYRLVLDSANPLNGTVECVLNGDDKSLSNPGRLLYQPDNICVTEDFVYVQEDPNGYTFPTSAQYVHDARIYQYDIITGTFEILLEADHHRSAPDSAIYNRNSAGTAWQNSPIGGWEFGAMTDLSDVTGVENSFLLCVQPHTWRYPHFAGIDGGTLRPSEKQGSQLLVITGVPRAKVFLPVADHDTICSGNTATLTASGGTSFWQTNGTTYHWYTQPVGGTPVATGAVFTTPALTVTTQYWLEAQLYGDSSTSRLAVNVVVTPIPAQPSITQTGTTLTSSSATGNQWYRNGVLIPGATNQNYVVTLDGYYTVTVTDNGCTSALSNEHFMNVTNIDHTVLLNEVRVFPNPNGGHFTIEFSMAQATEKFTVEIVNSIGQVIATDNVSNFSGSYLNTFDLSGESNGIYIVNIYTDKETFQKQMLKE